MSESRVSTVEFSLPRHDQTQWPVARLKAMELVSEIDGFVSKCATPQRTAILRLQRTINIDKPPIFRATQIDKCLMLQTKYPRSFAPSLVLPRRFPPRATWLFGPMLEV